MWQNHAYGALPGARIVLTIPTLFSKYVINSSSLWYNDGAILKRKRDKECHEQHANTIAIDTTKNHPVPRLELDLDDVEDLLLDIAQRCHRSMEKTEGNRYNGKVHTVMDLVLFINAQPKTSAT